MNETYQIYMKTKFPQEALSQWNKCFDFTAIMQKDFPELTVRIGYVFSFENRDNAHPDFPKQYPHAWLTDKQGNIIDPTVLQFCLLGELHYKEAALEDMTNRCEGCGQFTSERYCGKCHWSEVEPHGFINDIKKLCIALRKPSSPCLMECRIFIHFANGKPASAEWQELSQDRNTLKTIHSTLQSWDNGFLHFYTRQNEIIIPETELRLSEDYILEKNLSRLLEAPAIFAIGKYQFGLAFDESEV